MRFYDSPSGGGHWRLSPSGWWKEEDTVRFYGPVRLHLPSYNMAAWELEGKYEYPEFSWDMYPNKLIED